MRASSVPPSCAAQTKPLPAARRHSGTHGNLKDLVSWCVRVSMRKSRWLPGSRSHAEPPATTTSEGASPQPNFVPERKLASARPVEASRARRTSGCSPRGLCRRRASRKASTVPTAAPTAASATAAIATAIGRRDRSDGMTRPCMASSLRWRDQHSSRNAPSAPWRARVRPRRPTPPPTPAVASVTRGGGSFRWAKTTASSFSRSNGRSPDRHSNSTHPSA